MIIYKLPDLGEGLPDAIIREWYVKPGDKIKADQPMAAMETAKALVEVPAPFTGEVEKLFGNPGDTIETGQALIGFVGQTEEEPVSQNPDPSRIKATPAVRALAKKLGVPLTEIIPQGEYITAAEVEQFAYEKSTADRNGEFLSPMRRAMFMSMTDSHQRVVPITLSDDADITAWEGRQDITLRLIQALVAACQAVPIINATFDDNKMNYRLNEAIHLGIAVDTEQGLYVPVIKDVGTQSPPYLREKIDQFKKQAQEKTIAPSDLHGATIILSNYGALAGRYATPIIVPPMVAIVGVGRAREAVLVVEDKPAIRRIIPLSVTVDHRLITGGETAKFLKIFIDNLSQTV